MASSHPSPYGDECDICTELLKNPRVLDCDHVFCLDCLEKLERRKTITCPQCRKDTEITPGLHVKHLPKIRPGKPSVSNKTIKLNLVKKWETGKVISAVKIDEDNMFIYAGLDNPGKPVSVYTFGGKHLYGFVDGYVRPAIAIDTKRRLTLLGEESNEIVSYSSNGNMAGKICPKEVGHIDDISYQIQEDMYVVADDKSHCLHFISPSTESVVRSVPAEEARSATGGKRNVFMAASKSPHSSLLATLDNEKGLVKLYDGEGNFIKSYGGTGSGFGKLYRPCGICFDHQDRILVCDTGNHRLVRLSPDAVDESQEWEVIMDTSTLGLGKPRDVDVTQDGLVVMAMFTKVKDGPFNLVVFSGYE